MSIYRSVCLFIDLYPDLSSPDVGQEATAPPAPEPVSEEQKKEWHDELEKVGAFCLSFYKKYKIAR